MKKWIKFYIIAPLIGALLNLVYVIKTIWYIEATMYLKILALLSVVLLGYMFVLIPNLTVIKFINGDD